MAPFLQSAGEPLRRVTSIAAAVIALVAASPAIATTEDEPPDWQARPSSPSRSDVAPPSRTSPGATDAPLPLGAERPVPDYDGRPETPEPDGLAIWTARVLLSPLWVASEALLRQPAHGVVRGAEEIELIGGVADEVTQDPDDTVGLTPVFVVEAGEHPMFGLYAQIEHLVAPWERLRGVASSGGVDVMRIHLVDEMRLADGAHLIFGARGLRRDDLVFYGRGPRSSERDARDFDLSLIAGEARLHLELAPRDLVSVEARSTVRRAHIGRDDPGALPPGHGGTTNVATGLVFAVDAPPPQGGGTSLGADLVLHAEEAANVAGPGGGSWVAWGGRGVLSTDLTGTRRVLALGAQLDFADPLSRSVEIPVVDLPGARPLASDLEGDLLLGVRPGRTTGQSLLQAALDYEWPIWAVLDGHLQVGVGNAFDDHLAGFDPARLRFAFAGGLEAPLRRDFAVRALAGFSTDTFDRGAEPALARVLVSAGTNL